MRAQHGACLPRVSRAGGARTRALAASATSAVFAGASPPPPPLPSSPAPPRRRQCRCPEPSPPSVQSPPPSDPALLARMTSLEACSRRRPRRRRRSAARSLEDLIRHSRLCSCSLASPWSRARCASTTRSQRTRRTCWTTCSASSSPCAGATSSLPAGCRHWRGRAAAATWLLYAHSATAVLLHGVASDGGDDRLRRDGRAHAPDGLRGDPASSTPSTRLPCALRGRRTAAQQLDPPFHDFAGSGVVHLLGGAAVLAGAAVVGARAPGPVAGVRLRAAQRPFVLGGVLVLWVAWYAFNAGSTAGMETSPRRPRRTREPPPRCRRPPGSGVHPPRPRASSSGDAAERAAARALASRSR